MTEPKFTKVTISPDELFAISCPECAEIIEIQALEGDDGNYEPDDEDRFVKCTCGELLEAVGVRLTPLEGN